MLLNIVKMPRNRRNDDARTPILQDAADTHQYDDNELSQDSGAISCANICDPRSTFYRFFGLIFMCLVGFGKFDKSLVQSNKFSL